MISDKTEIHLSDDRVLAVHVKIADSPDTALSGEPKPSDWFRSIRLTPSAVADKTTSSVKNGVLTIHIPKVEAPKAKLIPVTAEK